MYKDCHIYEPYGSYGTSICHLTNRIKGCCICIEQKRNVCILLTDIIEMNRTECTNGGMILIEI